jgi:hypothetical protein
MTAHSLQWSHGRATVLTTAAMLADCQFTLPTGKFAPFAHAPWMGTVTDPVLSGHLRELGGDFVCLPFGGRRVVPNAPPDWAPVLVGPEYEPIHGPAADRDWTITQSSPTAIALTLDYPADSPVLRIERTITAQINAPALDFSLTIFAREPAEISVGLHPILRLPNDPGRLSLTADFDFGLVHPGQTTPGQPQDFNHLSSVPRANCQTIDMTRLPLSPATDLNVQLCGMRGPITAHYLDERAAVEIDWDRALLPSLQIWHTDRGITPAPWNGQYRGLGLEPVASAFDLHHAVSTGPNPINQRGVATAIWIDPAAPTLIRHSIRAFAT